MQGRRTANKLSLVSDNPHRPSAPSCPAHLGKPEKELWREFVSEHDFESTAAVSLLVTALENHQLARECMEQIKRDGLTHRNKIGALKAHPLLGTEARAKQQYIMTIKKLKLEL
jgi:hypothetical protein